jgi:multidrug efflux system outer membrane protein
MKSRLFTISLLSLCIWQAGCSLSKPPETVDVDVPADYREVVLENAERWKIAAPSDALDRGQWWRVFGDDNLSSLIVEASSANPTLSVALSRVQEARALAGLANADSKFQLGLGAGPTRQGTANSAQTMLRTQLNASYEVDLFGGLSDNTRAATLEVMGEEAAYQSVLLALQSDLAQTYFDLRTFDSEIAILEETIKLRRESVDMVERQFEAGDRSELETAQAQTELATTQASLEAVRRQRSASDHALAVLLGKPASDFTLANAPLVAHRIYIPAGLPSDLLERRPDIAQAQRQLAAASARIGVAKSAFFPRLVLTASGGFESSDLGELFKWSSRSWLLGPLIGTALNVPLLDGGRNQANLARADALYEGAIAAYKNQVLIGFKDVEDNLSAIRTLTLELEYQDQALESARRAASLADTRYTSGSTSYFESIDAQRTRLVSQRLQAQVAGQRAKAYVGLIKALGGGWGRVDNEPASAAATLSSL